MIFMAFSMNENHIDDTSEMMIFRKKEKEEQARIDVALKQQQIEEQAKVDAALKQQSMLEEQSRREMFTHIESAMIVT